MEVCLEVWRTSMNYKVIRDFRLFRLFRLSYPVKPLFFLFFVFGVNVKCLKAKKKIKSYKDMDSYLCSPANVLFVCFLYLNISIR